MHGVTLTAALRLRSRQKASVSRPVQSVPSLGMQFGAEPTTLDKKADPDPPLCVSSCWAAPVAACPRFSFVHAFLVTFPPVHLVLSFPRNLLPCFAAWPQCYAAFPTLGYCRGRCVYVRPVVVEIEMNHIQTRAYCLVAPFLPTFAIVEHESQGRTRELYLLYFVSCHHEALRCKSWTNCTNVRLLDS
jgi:hypothetical protein